MKLHFSLLVLGTFLAMACASKPKDTEQEPAIDREQVRGTIRTGLKEVRNCYETFLKTGAKGEGKLVMEFTITDEGNAINIEPNKKSSTFIEPTMVSCMQKSMATWKFPPTPPKTKAEVNYPFYFKSNPDGDTTAPVWKSN